MTSLVSRRDGRLLLAAAVLCIFAFAARASAGSTGASPAPLASQLAARVSSAKTSGARYQALVAVMKALHVPVFTKDGKAVTAGSRGLPAGFNLYDFELKGVADLLGQRESTSLSDLAAVYATAGVSTSAQAFAAKLRSGVRAAVAKPNAASSLAGLLVRDLGLHDHPAVDLSRAVSATTSLDPLQELLLVSDSAARSLRGSRAPAAVSGSTESADACPEPDLGSQEFANGQPLAPSGAPSFGRKLYTGYLLIRYTKMTAVDPSTQETHYGPLGHAAHAGEEMKLSIKLEVTETLPNSIRCGILKNGGDFPPKGPLKGMKVTWDTGDLATYGTISYRLGTGLTDSFGIATLVFKPKNEKFPNFGTLVTRDGSVLASTAGFHGFQVVNRVKLGWKVSYHKPRGFKFTLPAITFQNTAPDGEHATIVFNASARVCGDDPFGTPWTITESATRSPTVNYELTLPDGVPAYIGTDFVHQWTLTSLPQGSSSPLKADLQITAQNPAAGTFVPNPGTSQANVVEDTSCPDNSDGG
jgi:hypothetical protein